jgi:hypothetical protein
MFQTISVHDLGASIDAGRVDATLDGWFGGWAGQDDTATLIASFRDRSGNPLGTPFQVGGANSNAAARGGNSGFVRETLSAALPVGTRVIELELRFDKIPSGVHQDGAADTLSLVLTRR